MWSRSYKALTWCGLWLFSGCGGPPPATVHGSSSHGSPLAGASSEARALAHAFEARLTVHRRRDGTRVLSRHCRNGPVDCRQRLDTFAVIIEEAARRNGLDPFLLGALAFRESGLNPAAVSRAGAAGLVQLHPRGVGHGVRYVIDADYRQACQRRIDACQGPVVELGARALADAVERCGSLRAALGKYATGRCTERVGHAERVLEERTHLRSLAP